MKVGILTYHRAVNYGAVLQAYALQYTIASFQDTHCYVIDYENKKMHDKRMVKFSLKNPVGYFFKKQTQNGFTVFLKKYIPLSAKCYDTKDVEQTASEFDKVICGSDQVFNPYINNFDDVYVFNFSIKADKKYTYAASLGSADGFSKELKDYFAPLNEMPLISLREERGEELFNLIVSSKVRIDIDPVLLVDKMNWELLAKKPMHKKYILLYTIGKFDKELLNIAKLKAKQQNCTVLWLSDGTKPIQEIKRVRMSTPEQFVGLFQNATGVVTNSFHGTAFSVIFQKDFYVDIKNDGNFNSRADNLLSLLKLPSEVIDGNANWKEAEQILEQHKAASIDYLKDIVVKKEG